MTREYCHNKKRKFLVKRGRREPYRIFILSNINIITLSNMYAMDRSLFSEMTTC